MACEKTAERWLSFNFLRNYQEFNYMICVVYLIAECWIHSGRRKSYKGSEIRQL